MTALDLTQRRVLRFTWEAVEPELIKTLLARAYDEARDVASRNALD